MNLSLTEGYIFKLLFIKYASIVLERERNWDILYDDVNFRLQSCRFTFLNFSLEISVPNSLSDLDVTLFAFIICGFHEEFFEGLLNV